VEGRFRRFDGDFRWFLFRGSPLRDQSGKAAKWYGTNTDLEERKRAEETLQRSEGYLAEAQKLTHTGSWAVHVPEMENAQGEGYQALAVIPRFGWDASYWSKEMYRIFGLDPGPTPPSSMEVVRRLDPEDARYNTPLVEQAIRDRTDFETDYRLLLPNGPAKYIHVVGHPVVNASGDVIELVGTAMDVTERNRAEDALRESEASLLEAQRLTRTCSWRHEVLSDKVTVSPEGLLMYGIKPEDDASSAGFYFKRIHREDRPEVEQAYEAAVVGKTDFEADFRIVLPDGTIKNTRSIGHPILDERGDVVEFVGASIDVTETEGCELPEMREIKGSAGENRERLLSFIECQGIPSKPAAGMRSDGRPNREAAPRPSHRQCDQPSRPLCHRRRRRSGVVAQA
jgi:PAS domain-containing protein